MLLVTGCNDVRPAEQTLIDGDTIPASAESPSRVESAKGSPVGPAYKTVELQREGITDTMRLRLTGSARGFDPPFYTYVPADMIFEPLDPRQGQGFKFTANFAGRRRNDAFMLMLVYPSGTTAAAARANLDAYIAGREELPSETRRQGWTEVEKAFRGTTQVGDRINGWVGLGRHGDGYFIMATEYPPEFGEGMGVRIDQIMKEWRWLPGDIPLSR